MPSHCGNRLTIIGDKKHRDLLVAQIAGPSPNWEDTYNESYNESLCLDRIIPIPFDILELGFDNAGYIWCVEHWGTKWGCYNTNVIHNDLHTIYTFNTAWSPLSQDIFNRLTTAYPTLKFRLVFAEITYGFYGCFDSDDGCFKQYFQEPDVDELRLVDQLSEFQEVLDISG